jgi:hypothetical protein
MKTDFDATGDVRAVDLLAAFVGIWRANRSGLVRFTRPGSSAGFDFADGELVGAFSSDPRFEASAILVRAGKLDAAALERLTVPPGTDGALAALQAGILTRREWKWGEKIRAIEILAELLGWPDGKYLFDFDARPIRAEFSLAIPRLILELFLRSRDRHLVDHQLGPMDLPLTRSEKFDEEFATFGLTADAESVVHLIDGEASASEICARAPAEEFAVLKLLAALRTLDLLRPEAGAVAAPVLEPVIGRREVDEPLASEREANETLPPPVTSPPEEIESESKRFSFPSIDPFPSPATTPQLPSEVPIESIQDPEADDPALDVEVGDVAPGWEDAPPARRDWESPSDDLDRELDTAIDPPVPPGGGFPLARLLWILLGVLVVAVAGLVFFRSRRGPETVTAANRAAARPSAPAPHPAMAAALATPTAVVTLPAAPSPTRVVPPTPTARSRLAKPTAVPTKPAASKSPEPGRAQWVARARSDRRKLDQDPRTRYAIQLELACETPSLAEAWKHDQPPGSMWLLPMPHQGKDCFRVLWGRFPSLEAARKAKGGAPLFFSTTTNHPAVVSVR